jgi:ABC-2 type transport system ATP-binding protein
MTAAVDSSPAVAVSDVSFAYPAAGRGPRKASALQGISFSVHQGEIFGLLGPNGGGKTTLFKILSTLLAPASGQLTIAGLDVTANPRAVRAGISETI